jgi:hypothetical protein
MYRALASVIFAGLAASAYAHPTTTAIIVKPQTTTPFKRPSGVEAVKVSLPRNVSVAASGKSAAPAPVESDRSPYGMLFATVAVMAAIAVRRQRTGRS